MWEFAVPPHKGDEHFDLGIWHPSAYQRISRTGKDTTSSNCGIEKKNRFAKTRRANLPSPNNSRLLRMRYAPLLMPYRRKDYAVARGPSCFDGTACFASSPSGLLSQLNWLRALRSRQTGMG